MILQSLVQLATNEQLIADPDFEFKPVSWIVRLDRTGRCIGVNSFRRNLTEGEVDKRGKPAKPKWIGQKKLVPIQFVRTYGDAAYFAVDKAEYVFGFDPSGVRPPEKLLARMALFYGAFEKCHAVTSDASIGSVVAFGRSLATLPLEARGDLLPKELTAGDLIMFQVGDDNIPVHERPDVSVYWKGQRNPEKPAPTSAGPVERRCLITSKPVIEVPLFRKVKNVPGDASGGLSLVSFNAPAWESYGWAGENNAPVSREPAEAAITALSRLLDPRPTNGNGDALNVRRIRMGDDTAVVFWSPAPTREVQGVLDGLPDLLDSSSNITDVGNLLVAARTGILKPIDDPATFYAMTLTSVTGRVVVRDWFEAQVSDVQRNLLQHFGDLDCVRNTPPVKGQPQRSFVRLNDLMDALATPGRDGKVPATLAAGFIRAALRGSPYPFAILQRALVRERAEVGGDEWSDAVRRDARAALVKAVLNRRRRSDATIAGNYVEIKPAMDPHNQSQGYNLGALLSVLERLQAAALGSVNASVVDKYFAAASATPRVVFDRLLRSARHHARKALDTDEKAARQAHLLERLIDELVSRFHPPASDAVASKHRLPTPPADGIPLSLDLEQQGLFVIGYHHMRKFLWMDAEERAAWEAQYPNAPRAFLRKRSSKGEGNDESANAA